VPEETPKSDDVEELMKMLGVDPGKVSPPGPAVGPRPQPSPSAQEDVQEMVRELKGGKPAPPPADSKRPEYETFAPAGGRAEASIDLLKDINLHARVELGRSRMFVQDILRLSPGSVVELERLTGDPLDVYVNDRLVARGEVLVINENFAIRITEVINPAREREK
jgi:flagellar motor switch protein FliN/FliY